MTKYNGSQTTTWGGGYLAISRDMFDCHTPVGGGEESAIDIYWIEAKDVVKHPTVHKMTPPKTSIVPRLEALV